MAFVSTAWTSPETNLSPDDFCACCLIDLNAPGKAKVKGECYLPVRNKPSGPTNTNAMSAAAGYLIRTQVPADAKRKAARKLASLYREAKLEPPPSVVKIAGG